MSYGYVEKDKEIVFKSDLPKSWKNISGFNNLSDEEAKEHGWCVVEEVASGKEDWQTVTEKTYEVGMDDVIRPVYVIEDDTLEEYKTKRIVEMKQSYKEFILAEYDEETQRNAALGIETPTIITAMKTFIQSRRVDYKDNKTLINNASTLEEVEAVTWL